MASKEFTHARLIELAAVWLQRQRCAVVTTDIVTGTPETPDALGFRSSGFSILCEAKSSRADFLRDRRKPFRAHSHQGVGHMRYYVCAPDIVLIDELPEGWGLLVPHGSGLKKVHQSRRFAEYNHRGEHTILVSLLRRIGQSAPDGIAVNCYTYKVASPKATVGIVESEWLPIDQAPKDGSRVVTELGDVRWDDCSEWADQPELMPYPPGWVGEEGPMVCPSWYLPLPPLPEVSVSGV